jgi:hypothetical protein
MGLIKTEEAVSNEKVSELIAILRDERFSNEDQRKKMVDIISSLMNFKDADARKFFKALGDACTSIGEDMLQDDEDDSPEYEEGTYEYNGGKYWGRLQTVTEKKTEPFGRNKVK